MKMDQQRCKQIQINTPQCVTVDTQMIQTHNHELKWILSNDVSVAMRRPFADKQMQRDLFTHMICMDDKMLHTAEYITGIYHDNRPRKNILHLK